MGGSTDPLKKTLLQGVTRIGAEGFKASEEKCGKRKRRETAADEQDADILAPEEVRPRDPEASKSL